MGRKSDRRKSPKIKRMREEAEVCYYCGRKFEQYGLRKIVEHFLPFHKKGNNGHRNKTISCHQCDDWKSDKHPKGWAISVQSAIDKHKLGPYTLRQLKRILVAIDLFDICH